MHSHICRFCEETYTCEKSADVCFRESIVCQDCSFGTVVWRFIGLMVLAVIASVLTLFLLGAFEWLPEMLHLSLLTK